MNAGLTTQIPAKSSEFYSEVKTSKSAKSQIPGADFKDVLKSKTEQSGVSKDSPKEEKKEVRSESQTDAAVQEYLAASQNLQAECRPEDLTVEVTISQEKASEGQTSEAIFGILGEPVSGQVQLFGGTARTQQDEMPVQTDTVNSFSVPGSETAETLAATTENTVDTAAEITAGEILGKKPETTAVANPEKQAAATTGTVAETTDSPSFTKPVEEAAGLKEPDKTGMENQGAQGIETEQEPEKPLSPPEKVDKPKEETESEGKKTENRGYTELRKVREYARPGADKDSWRQEENQRSMGNQQLEALKSKADMGAQSLSDRMAGFKVNGSFATDDATDVKPSTSPIFDQMKSGLTQGFKDDLKEFTIKLKPEGLGEIVVKMVNVDGKIAVRMAVSSPETEKLISSQMSDLKRLLEPYHAHIEEVYHNSQNGMGFAGFGQDMYRQQYPSGKAGHRKIGPGLEPVEGDNFAAEAEKMMADSRIGKLYTYV